MDLISKTMSDIKTKLVKHLLDYQDFEHQTQTSLNRLYLLDKLDAKIQKVESSRLKNEENFM